MFAQTRSCLAIAAIALAAPALAGDLAFQVSTSGALMSGVYDGDTTVGDLLEQGGFGVGTYNGLDGEMVALDGVFYRVGPSGKATAVEREAKTPFAVVTSFAGDARVEIAKGSGLDAIGALIDAAIPSPNYVYAIRIDGRFESIRLRGLRAQSPPYRPFAEIAEEAAVVRSRDRVEGTLVGYRFPAYLGDVNVAGYHFHFLSADRTIGGHVIDVTAGEASAEIDQLERFVLSMPQDRAFREVRLPED